MKKFLSSFQFAIKGVRLAVAEQLNIKVQLAGALIAVLAGFCFQITVTEWCVVVLCIGLVLALEVMNSAIENLVDLVTTERNPMAGKIKDMAAGAVLIASVTATIIGILIFGRHIF